MPEKTSSEPSSSQGSSSFCGGTGQPSSSNATSRGFRYKSSGVNNEGNHYCARDYGPGASNSNSYHYSNTDGSYYYSNPNGSTYYNDGKGGAVYKR